MSDVYAVTYGTQSITRNPFDDAATKCLFFGGGGHLVKWLKTWSCDPNGRTNSLIAQKLKTGVHE